MLVCEFVSVLLWGFCQFGTSATQFMQKFTFHFDDDAESERAEWKLHMNSGRDNEDIFKIKSDLLDDLYVCCVGRFVAVKLNELSRLKRRANKLVVWRCWRALIAFSFCRFYSISISIIHH